MTLTCSRVVLGLVLLVLATVTGELRAARQAADAVDRVDVVVRAGTVVTVDEDRRVLSPGSVAIRGDTIVAVGSPEAIAQRFEADAVMDLGSDILLPGLVNTHGHVPMVLYRGLADDLALMDWLQQYIFPAEAKTVSPEFVRAGMRLGALEMIRSGTTTFADMYYFESDAAAVAKAAGLRAVLGQTVIEFPVADAATPVDALALAESFIEAWRDDPLITPAVAPHSMYTLDAATLTAVRDLARRYDVPVLIHLSETQEEGRISEERHGMSPTAYLASIEFWEPRVLAAHGVWLSDADIDILKEHGVAVSHNPESNMKLASGIAPVPKLLEAGVVVGLGTDGAASNNDLDMFDAMRQAALLHKLASNDPRTIPAPAALEMATTRGAEALGLGASVGSIVVGKKADLISVSVDSARFTPMYDPVSHLVYVARGSDVRTTIVNGRVLMRDGEVFSLDEEAVLAEASAMAERVREAVR